MPKAKLKQGRPKITDPRERQIAVRITPEEREELAAAANRDQRPLSQWLRIIGLERARSGK